MGRAHPLSEHPIGPTITGVIDCRDQKNPLDGFVIEEGAITAPLVPLLRAMLEFMPGKIRPSSTGLTHKIARVQRSLLSLALPYASTGSLQSTQTYLIMSHDSNQAIISEATCFSLSKSDSNRKDDNNVVDDDETRDETTIVWLTNFVVVAGKRWFVNVKDSALSY